MSSKKTFLILFGICVISIFLSLTLNLNGGPFKVAADVVFGPMQRGLNQIGLVMTSRKNDFQNLQELTKENDKLQAQVEELTTENSTLKLKQYELEELQQLYELDQKYPSYKKTGARVIARDASNWFNTFVIDKGSKDGIKVDMNVIAGGGLVGRVTSVSKSSATVTSIINDTCAFSGMMISTSDYCIVRGSLASMTEDQTILFDTLKDTDNKVTEGEQVVTSNISQKYLEGILVGYVTTIKTDSNNLTKSGTITPIVDFEHLEEVLVILEKKETE
ncbi:MAG: rod shape-determining protein MreC [Lachnospiraceae bacterium]|nr:rod shape-determining protein MreC [Lachnospiraceae bacterium]